MNRRAAGTFDLVRCLDRVRARLLALAVGGSACTGVIADHDADLVTEIPEPVVEVVLAEEPAWCVYEDPPLPAPEPKVVRHGCRQHRSHAVRSVERRLKEHWTPTFEPSRLEIHQGCDSLDDDIERIVVEVGSGHGFTLQLWELARTDAAWQIRRLEYHRDPSRESGEVGVAALDGERVQRLLEEMRVALVSEMIEVQLSPEDVGSVVLSSGNFHLLIRLEDSYGKVLERRYTGYPGNGLEESPVRVAARGLRDVLDELEMTPRAPEPEDRTFFVERFTAAAPHFDDQYYWWVRQRYVAMAGPLGTSVLVPNLVDHATRTTDRAREESIVSLSMLTGRDLRLDAHGRARPPHEVAQDYAVACRPEARGDDEAP